MRRSQRTFRPDHKEHRRTCFWRFFGALVPWRRRGSHTRSRAAVRPTFPLTPPMVEWFESVQRLVSVNQPWMPSDDPTCWWFQCPTSALSCACWPGREASVEACAQRHSFISPPGIAYRRAHVLPMLRSFIFFLTAPRRRIISERTGTIFTRWSRVLYTSRSVKGCCYGNRFLGANRRKLAYSIFIPCSGIPQRTGGSQHGCAR